MHQLDKWKIYRCECGHSKYDHADEHDEVPTGTGHCDAMGTGINLVCECDTYRNRQLTLQELIALVKELHDKNAYHRKRGFQLQDSTKILASSHMLEEAVELQAEACIEEDHDGVIEESSDVLATWLHLLLHCEVDFQEVIDRCVVKLLDTFTYDPNDLLTDTPGYSRRHRQGDTEGALADARSSGSLDSQKATS